MLTADFPHFHMPCVFAIWISALQDKEEEKLPGCLNTTIFCMLFQLVCLLIAKGRVGATGLFGGISVVEREISTGLR